MPSSSRHAAPQVIAHRRLSGAWCSSPFCWRYQGPVLAIRREHAVESSQVSPGLRHQGSKPSHEIQWLEDDVGSAVPIRCLQLVADVADRLVETIRSPSGVICMSRALPTPRAYTGILNPSGTVGNPASVAFTFAMPGNTRAAQLFGQIYAASASPAPRTMKASNIWRIAVSCFMRSVCHKFPPAVGRYITNRSND